MSRPSGDSVKLLLLADSAACLFFRASLASGLYQPLFW